MFIEHLDCLDNNRGTVLQHLEKVPVLLRNLQAVAIVNNCWSGTKGAEEGK